MKRNPQDKQKKRKYGHRNVSRKHLAKRLAAERRAPLTHPETSSYVEGVEESMQATENTNATPKTPVPQKAVPKFTMTLRSASSKEQGLLCKYILA